MSNFHDSLHVLIFIETKNDSFGRIIGANKNGFVVFFDTLNNFAPGYCKYQWQKQLHHQ